MSSALKPEDKSRIQEIQSLLEGESPRSKILIAGAGLDESLKRLLELYLLPKDRDELLNQYAPIGDFKVRIDLTERLGLITPQLSADLHQIRKLRNDCAHRLEEFDFEAGSIRDRVELIYNRLGSFLKDYFYEGEEPETFEEKFDFTTSAFLHYLEDLCKEMHPLRPPSLEALLYSDKKPE